MSSFDADFSPFASSRRNRVFSDASFSLRPDSSTSQTENGGAESFLSAFEATWNAEATAPSRALKNSKNEKKARRSSKNVDDQTDVDDRAEFERLRRLAENLADNFADRKEKTRRAEVAQRFVDRSTTDAEAEFDAESSSETDVETAFQLDGPPDATATVAGKAYYYFGGDGYLGLQADPEMLATACEAALKYGLASATSRRRLVSAPVKEVERNAAKFFGTARAFYSLNEATVGETLLKTILGSVDRFFVDEKALPFWTPIFEKLERGATFADEKTARATKSSAKKWTPIPFRHCDAFDLREKMRLRLGVDERPLAITDGVFGDCGTVAPLDRIVDALEIFPGSALLIDDSNGIGVLGENGRGTFERFRFDPRQINRTIQETAFHPFDDAATDDFWSEEADASTAPTSKTRRIGVRLYSFASLAKAVGGFGCVAAGSESFVEKMSELSDDFAGTSPSNPIAAATARGLRILATTPELRARLRENVERLRSGLRGIGLEVDDSPIPVVAIQLGSQQNMRRIQRKLAEKRILVSFHPTRRGRARGFLRVAVFATHSPEAIDALVDSLREVF